MKISFIYGILLFLSVSCLTGFAQQNTTIKVDDVAPGEIQYKAFMLNSNATIEINGQAATFRGRHDSWFFNSDDREGWTNNLLFYCWILEAKTRDVVWNSLEVYPDIRTSRETKFIPIKTNLDLPAGNYEVYYVSAKRYYNERVKENGNVISWIKDFFGFDKTEFRSKYEDELFIEVSGPRNVFYPADINQFRKDFLSNAIVKLEDAGDDASLSDGFSLKNDTKLKVYAIGEGGEKEIFDYAWIYDEVKNRIVWKMNWDNTDYAGGAEKNILFDDVISLPAGTYTVHYVTDDSHSFENWNSFPPDDPQFWGVAVFPASISDLANVIPFKQEDVVEPVVDLIKVGDDQLVWQGLRIKDPTEIHILCLGESISGKRYVDYGWIINADTHETVWTMDGRSSVNAGGAEKNRIIDENITLQPGNYIVYYATDGSHSYEEWNSAKPYDPSKWGITLWTLDNKSKANTELFSANDYKNKNVLAEIVRVRDDKYLQKSFELKNVTKIRVYAIGEGFTDEMVDYGWIENSETGKVVWDMSYGRTENAGGADKNRSINEVITLPKGKYILYYKTDDSHSYRDWNDDPPTDQDDYGITLSYAK